MSTVIKGSGSGQINLNDTTGSIQLNGSDVLTIDSSGNLTAPNNLTANGSITGDGSGLTGIPAANLTGDLPAISGANLTNIATAIPDSTITGAKLASATVTADKLDTTYLTPTGDGSLLTGLGGGGFSNMQVFTSPGTWTNPGSVTKVKVTVVGGGGSGDQNGPGGGSGGAAIEIIPFPSGTNVPVTVGAARIPTFGNGASGNTSSFGAYCSATGGTGSSNTFNSGGSGSGGLINAKGGANTPGSGGNSLFGGGGKEELEKMAHLAVEAVAVVVLTLQVQVVQV